MEGVSLRVWEMAESETIAMSQRSRELQSQGISVINLSVGEPDFATPDHIKEAARQAIEANFSHYSPIPGFPQLRAVIAEKLRRDNGLDYTIDQIVVSNGAKQAIFNAVLSVINPGDEVIVPAPYWVSYLEIIKLAQGQSVVVNGRCETGYKMTPDQLEAAITPKTRLLFLNSPSNPTGAVYSKQELEALARVLEKHPRILVLSDEIYEYIVYEGEHVSIACFPWMKERVMVINGFSKGFAMTGWRIGYVAAPVWVAKACAKLQGQQTSGACSIAQMAAAAAFTDGLQAPLAMLEAFRRRRDLVLALARQIEGLEVQAPAGAFYIFPDVHAFYGKSDGSRLIENANDLGMYLLEKGHVACVSGSAFGSPKNLRISYAAGDEQLKEAMRRIKQALEKLQ